MASSVTKQSFNDLKNVYYKNDDPELMPKDFLTKYREENLPVIMRVTQGYDGYFSLSFSGEDVYFITEVWREERAILTDPFNQNFTFPTHHRLKFHVEVDNFKCPQEPVQLFQVKDLHAAVKAKKEAFGLHPMKHDHVIPFYKTPDTTVDFDVDLLYLARFYHERYLVGYPILNDVLVASPTIIPLWMDMTIDVAVGLKSDSHTNYKKLLDSMQMFIDASPRKTLSGIKEIIMRPSGSEKGYTLYDTLQPANDDYETPKSIPIPDKITNLDQVKDESKLTASEVTDCLCLLNLGKYADTFKDNQINGALLCQLNLEDFRELGMKNVEANRIHMFANGWRPT